MLPPSEGKTPPVNDAAAALDLRTLTLPQVTDARQRVLDELIGASGRDDAQEVLKVGAKVMAEVRANTELKTAPTTPSYEIYTGVLFDALDAQSLTQEQLQRATETVLIFSGLFGLTGFADPIPAYRLSMDVKLGDLGNIGTWWKKQLKEPMAQHIGDQLVLDCRSSSYAKAFQPPPQQTLVVNNFTERDGHRKVVTHHAKYARGLLTGMLLRADRPLETIDDVVAIAEKQWQVEVRPTQGRTPHQLDLINT